MFAGARAFVYWPDDEAWYAACVVSFEPLVRRHLVLYDDLEWEHLDLAAQYLRFVMTPLGAAEVAPTTRPNGRPLPAASNG